MSSYTPKPLINPKHCYTTYTMYDLLESIDPSFSAKKSLMVGTLNIKSNDDKFIRCGGFLDFAFQYNTYFTDAIDTSKSFQSGKVFYLFLKEDIVFEETTHKDIEIVPETVPEKVEVVIDTTTTDEEETLSELDTDTPVDEKEVNWDWVNGLDNTKEDKLALDQYAEDHFSIKLSRTMKIENMIKKFKEELEKL